MQWDAIHKFDIIGTTVSIDSRGIAIHWRKTLGRGCYSAYFLGIGLGKAPDAFFVESISVNQLRSQPVDAVMVLWSARRSRKIWDWQNGPVLEQNTF